ncbi:ABC transporter permease [Clostridium weizhouense]|uniref:ABC transporter permease n=1 Tax=Clostridium weizhouense TaxID=2859781 RepID=A0ABS7AMU9_9CLOT|nr:ABC transporter permease [Clostridium weizhouense]MBW6409977.1 ABC transporter permease [Clostridium weizhouense]
MNNKKTSILAYPYIIWSALFIVIPLIIVLFFSFTQKINSSYSFSLDNYNKLLNPQYLYIFKQSLWLAFESTIACLILGYPISYIIAKIDKCKRNFLIMLFILPMWMNFLLRTYAWVPILGKTGLVNLLLRQLGIGPISFLYNDGAVLLGMVYNFLPFMVLPIYTSLIKMDQDLINAAHDLGAGRIKVFTKIIIPLSIPGMISGITMVFMPSVSTFVISRLLGGGQYMLLGNVIEQQFTTMGDWNLGSAISIIMMIIILIFMALTSRFENNDSKEGGGQLW